MGGDEGPAVALPANASEGLRPSCDMTLVAVEDDELW